jgi:hypothetical protein
VRAEVGLVLLSLGLWACGACVLLGCGVASLDRRSLLVWSGASYVVGVACVGVLLTVTTIAGVTLSSGTTALVMVVVGGLGLAAWRLARVAPLPAVDDTRDGGIRFAAFVVFGLFLVAGTAVALVQPIFNWDGWAIWGVKSLILYDHGRIPDELAYGAYGLSHVDYPMLWPVLEAAHYRVMGGPEPKLVTFPHWLLYVGFAGTVAAVGARLTRPAIWVPAAVGTLTTYAVLDQVFWHYADVPTAVMAGGGALFGGLWLAGRGARWLVPCALLLAACANGKNEGLMAAVAVLLALAVGALLSSALERRALLNVLACAVAVGLAVLPWRLWMSANSVEGDIKASRALDPGVLADESSRVEPSAHRLWEHLSDQESWGYLAFAALLLIGVSVARRSTRALGAYYGVAGGLIFLFLVVAYWVAGTPLDWHLNTSADRVVMSVGFVGMAAVLQLAAALYEEGAEP